MTPRTPIYRSCAVATAPGCTGGRSRARRRGDAISIASGTLMTLVAASLVLALLPPNELRAQVSAPAPRAAPVVYRGDTLFALYGSLGPFSPEARAGAIIDGLARLEETIRPSDTLDVRDRGTYTEVSLGGSVVMTITDEDATPTGMPRSVLAGQYASRLQSSLLDAAARMQPRAVLIHAGYAVLATLVLILVLALLSRGTRHLRRRIDALGLVSLPSIRIQRFELLSAGRLAAVLHAATRALRVALTLFVLYVYVPLVLSFFPWTEPLSQQIIDLAWRPFAAAGAGFVAYLPDLFSLAAGIIITRYALALLHLVFGAVRSGAITIAGFYADWAEPTYKIVRVLVLAFAATVLYPYLPGASSDAFKGVSIFLGILFSLGSSAAVGNMVAGVVLTYTRAFQLGDRVKIGDSVGDVTEKTLLVTRLRTVKQVEVTIPNGAVLANQIVNYSTMAARGGVVLHTSVTIGYDAPWTTVHGLLIEAGGRTAHVLAEPAPFVLQTSLDDFYVSYELNVHTNRPDLMPAIYSRLHENIQDAFNAAGVEIMSPHYRAVRDGNSVTIPANPLAPVK